ncbi:MAG: carbohydate-binding domain-containing protein [Bacteroidales bacterium]|nr:carbohydate-binding domain-containing protein [Bacteroidales bacterium]
MRQVIIVLAFLTLFLSGFSQVANLKVSWKVLSNQYQDKSLTLSEFEFRNDGKTAIKGGDVSFYFNFIRPVVCDSVKGDFKCRQLNGNFFVLEPAERFPNIAAGKNLKVRMVSRHWTIQASDFPNGGYFVENGKAVASEIDIKPISDPKQTLTSSSDYRYPETAENRFAENAQLSLLPGSELPPFLPMPASWKYSGQSLFLPQDISLTAPAELRSESAMLTAYLKEAGINVNRSARAAISLPSVSLEIVPNAFRSASAYALSIKQPEGVRIQASGSEGIFYGIQSFHSLLLTNGNNLPCLEVADSARFGYRGFMLDVARNFRTKEEIRQLIDLLALYKFNKFHFHLTDDEGWRLEINGIPELTSYGSFRGHSPNEAENLYPAYGSGPLRETGASSGSGFYNRSSFIEILRYAAERHIEIIPEIDLPGHARAAVKAMDYRYRKYMALGKPAEAMEYLLRDTLDKSIYSSAQGYDDNVICVCNESVYSFLKKVISEIDNMYRDAGLKLNTLHIGGDEVPGGAWEQSEVCRKFLDLHPEYPTFRSLSSYFAKRVNDILILKNIRMAGWEEISFTHPLAGGEKTVNEEMKDRNIQSYCWNSLWDGSDLYNSYTLANAGLPVIQANATQLYIDMAYSKDPQEPGFYWANFSNTRNVYKFSPYSIPFGAGIGKLGDTLGKVLLKRNNVNLSDRGRNSIKGIEGCLWGETLIDSERYQYMLLPRLLAVADKAWSAQDSWETELDSAKREQLFISEFNLFSNLLGQKELPMLEKMGWKFRIPLPGLHEQDGKILANTEFPGLQIRYASEGKAITLKSSLYKSGTLVRKGMQFSTVLDSGRVGRAAVIKE